MNNNTKAILVGIFSVIVLIVRFARCGNKIDKLQWQVGQKNYFEDCQAVLDSAYFYFKPVEEAMVAGVRMPDEQLQKITVNLYDMAAKAKAIDAFNDEGGYYKKRVVEFIEFERGLTCCYLPRYLEDIRNPKTMKMATVSNLKNWMDTYNGWSPKYQHENFNYHTQANFSLLRQSLERFADNIKGTQPRQLQSK